MRSAGAAFFDLFSRTVMRVAGVSVVVLVAACSGSVVGDPNGLGGNGGAGPSSGTSQDVGVVGVGTGSVGSGPQTSSVGTGAQTSSVGTGAQTSSVGTGAQTSSVSTGSETTVAVGVGPGSTSSVSTGSQTVGSGGFGAGSTVSSNVVGSAIAVSSSSGGAPCDNSGSCQTCQNCAWFGPCSNEATACDNTPSCVAIIQCYQNCMLNDQQCYSQCYWNHVAGHSVYDALFLCLDCSQCFNDCGGQQIGCPPTP